MSNLNMGADFNAYLEILGCTAQFKALSIVDRSAIHLNFGRLAMSVAGLVEDSAVASFDDEKNPSAREILTRARVDNDMSIGNEGADADLSQSPLVAEGVAVPSLAL